LLEWKRGSTPRRYRDDLNVLRCVAIALVPCPCYRRGIITAELSLLPGSKSSILGAAQANDLDQLRLLIAKSTPIDAAITPDRPH